MSPVSTTPGLRFAAALSTASDTRQAVIEVCQAACERLNTQADLAFVFASAQHAARFDELAAGVAERTGARVHLGATGESIVATAREIEGQPAVSLWLASLPGASIQPLRLDFERTAEGGTFVGWPDELAAEWPAGATLVLLADPFTFPADLLLERLNEDRPGVPVLGGMASGGYAPGENRLLLNRGVCEQGAVGALIHGPLSIRAVVSQGCRPIGRHFVVTKAERNVIAELSGRPALLQLQEIFDKLSPREQKLAQQGLHVGRVVNEYQGEFVRGDFLVRNCIGADRRTGAIEIGDFIRPGQTIQFHVRDAQTADEDLRELLLASRQAGHEAHGALLFTCNGRGTRLFDRPHHDAAVLAEVLGGIPVAGFFAQGEMGPIGGKNFLHGFTASAALFGPATSSTNHGE
ncbi:MAG TPA: FIST N-terminal domain-containing protein [Pirellulales bacterium]|nr:FIST N-terminal domain-containing protein [Pirellulales bacterium]